MSLQMFDTGLRHVRFLELLEVEGWRFKVYGMTLQDEPPEAGLVQHARELIAATVPVPATAGERHGVGFATVHAGESGDYVLIDWWQSKDLLKHHLFGAPHPHDGQLEYGWPRGVCCCIWELAVPWFERNAWYRHVLSRWHRPDMDAYLADRLEGTV